MPGPVFLEVEDVLALHADLIARFGGRGGVRDLALLESAVAAPRAASHAGYFHTDVIEMAAAYLYHLVRNHAFVDGNKRVGASAAAVFLDLHGVELDADPDEFADLVVGVAEGTVAKSAVAEFLRRRCRTA